MFRRRNSGAVADAVPAGLAERLYDWAVIRARSPSLYTECGVPDTIEGRFELLTLHIVVLLNRLRQENDGSARTSQALFDLYVSHLDGAMREMGVGDLAMGKRMRSLGEIFYGRAQAYEAAFAALPDRETLDARGPLNPALLVGQHTCLHPLCTRYGRHSGSPPAIVRRSPVQRWNILDQTPVRAAKLPVVDSPYQFQSLAVES